jgi:ATP-dependent Clp protease adaptor protein ClpS
LKEIDFHQITKQIYNCAHLISFNSAFWLYFTVIMNSEQTQIEAHEEVLTKVIETWQIVVWNDEVNTFEWVIETLIDICGHTEEQAEQCAMIIHNQGKYAVKQGLYEVLKPMCDAITERGIGATIESLVA